MATPGLGTVGTTANNSLQCLIFPPTAATSAADLATIAQGIKDDLNNLHPIYPGAYAQNGLLYVPNRGVLRVLAGDFVAIDAQGWPILLSANTIAAAGAPWVHT
jgi:hypothetical protein